MPIGFKTVRHHREPMFIPFQRSPTAGKMLKKGWPKNERASGRLLRDCCQTPTAGRCPLIETACRALEKEST
jgi:hypothetical protein